MGLEDARLRTGADARQHTVQQELRPGKFNVCVTTCARPRRTAAGRALPALPALPARLGLGLGLRPLMCCRTASMLSKGLRWSETTAGALCKARRKTCE